MNDTANAAVDLKCRWCGHIHLTPQCPAVKAIEYWPDGITVKRVEFFVDKPLVGPALSTNSPIT
jgi:hypothetical protein